jgi:hypothetical protein
VVTVLEERILIARETVEKAFRGEREETQAASFQSRRVF